MTYFLLFTVLFWLTTASFANLLFTSIQPGQWIDTLFNYQNWLRKLDENGHTGIVMPLGYCEFCYAFWINVLSYGAYLAFSYGAFDIWISTNLDSIGWKIFVNLVWFWVYVGIGHFLTMIVLTKIFRS